MSWIPSAIAKPAARVLSVLPALPWYGWGGIGLGIAILLGARSASATAEDGQPNARPAGSPPLLKLGSAGPWVGYLQGKLGLSQTSSFDDATLAAVKALQSSKGLTADGIVGPNTWKAMGETMAATPAPSPGGGGQTQPKPPAPPVTPTPANPFGLSDIVAAREAQIIGYVDQGMIDPQLFPLTWSAGGHSITVMVTRRALAIADASGRLTFSMTFNGAQALLDKMGLLMLTTRVADEIWKQGTKLTPTNQPWNTDSPVTGGKTYRMVEQSGKVEAKVAAAGDSGPIANEGKDWVMTRRFWAPPAGTNPSTKPAGASGSPHNSANFGLYMPSSGWSKSPGGADVIQSIGLAHDRGNAGGFVDYSQYVRGLLPVVTVDGQSMLAADVAADPALSMLLNDEGGTLPALRHPDLT